MEHGHDDAFQRGRYVVRVLPPTRVGGKGVLWPAQQVSFGKLGKNVHGSLMPVVCAILGMRMHLERLLRWRYEIYRH